MYISEYISDLYMLCCRFGKVLWGKLPEDMISGSRGWGIAMFADLLFDDDNHTRIFNTEYSIIIIIYSPTVYVT